MSVLNFLEINDLCLTLIMKNIIINALNFIENGNSLYESQIQNLLKCTHLEGFNPNSPNMMCLTQQIQSIREPNGSEMTLTRINLRRTTLLENT